MDARLAAAASAAGPTEKEIQNNRQRWFRGGIQWPAERQLQFNRSIVELLESIRDAAAEQRAQIIQTQEQVVQMHEQVAAAVSSLNERLQRLDTQVAESERASRSELQEQVQQVVAELRQSIAQVLVSQRESIQGLAADDETRIREAMTEVRGSIERAVAEQRAAFEALATEQRNAIRQIENDTQQRIQHVLDEQRVCIRQISLQHSEQAVLADRARRATESRLDELAKQLEQLGNTGHR